jgi:hypothetical protein
VSTHRRALEHNGYVIIPGFLGASEVDRAKAELASFHAMGRNPYLAEVPDIADTIFSDRMLEVAADLLDAEPMSFPDHVCQSKGGGFGYHKDSVDRWEPSGPDWAAQPYPMIRFGLYFEDFRDRSGSLAIQPGSHRGVEYARRAINVKTQPGDLVAWYFTTTHAANSPSPRWSPKRAPRVPLNRNRVSRVVCSTSRSVTESSFGRHLVQPYSDTRRVLFFPYAARSRIVARYLSYLLHRNYYQDIIQADPAQGTAPAAAQGRLDWFNPYPYLDRVDRSLMTEGFYQGEATRAAETLADDIWSDLRSSTGGPR